MNSSQTTPKELVELFSSVDHKQFDQDNSQTDFVNKQSKKYFCPYSAESIGKGRSVQVYRCRFGGRVRGKSCKENCPSIVKFYLHGDNIYSFHSADWNHNHEISPVYCNAHCNTLTDDQIRLINEQQKLYVLSGQIRSNLDVTVNTNIFYEVRRDTIK